MNEALYLDSTIDHDMFAGATPGDLAYVEALIRHEVGTVPSINIIFIGGTGLHHLLMKKPCVNGADPIERHVAVIETYLELFKKLALMLHLPIVYVGTMPVDPWSVLLLPSKRDWNDFADFTIPLLWDTVEAEIFGDGSRYPGLHHFRPSGLAHKCPGIRCDGMHFGSDFNPDSQHDYNCANSLTLWESYFADYLVHTFKE